jgi:hypothetical protein
MDVQSLSDALDVQLAFQAGNAATFTQAQSDPPGVEGLAEKLSPADLHRSGLLQGVMESCSSHESPVNLPMRREDWLFWRQAAERMDSLTQPELVHLITVRPRA